MTNIQPYHFEPEEPLQGEDDSIVLKKVESLKKVWELGTPTGVYVNSWPKWSQSI